MKGDSMTRQLSGVLCGVGVEGRVQQHEWREHLIADRNEVLVDVGPSLVEVLGLPEYVPASARERPCGW